MKKNNTATERCPRHKGKPCRQSDSDHTIGMDLEEQDQPVLRSAP